jgi:voltage-gated potassium channel
MKKKIYQIIEPAEDNILSKIYDIIMMVAIVVSLIPLAFKETSKLFNVVEYVTVSIFIIDYALRLFTAD